MKYLICFFSFCFLPLIAVQPSEELLSYSNTTKENRELNLYLEQFPYDIYTIYDVPSLGKFYVDDLPDSIKWHLRQGIYWESGIGSYVEKYSKPDTVVIDLGAHIGIHTITMSRKAGLNGLVIAFEPQSKIFRELHYNLILNECTNNVIYLPLAVGDMPQIVEMNVADPTNEGGTSVGMGGNKTYMITLDSLNLNDVSFIKMDVESYELKVLKGAAQTILRNKPVIVFEILGNHDLDTCTGEIKAQYDETLQFLTSLGYNVEKIFGNDFIAFPIQDTQIELFPAE